MAENLGFGPRAPFGLAIVCFAACFVVVTLTWSENYGNQVSKLNFLHSMAKSRLFSHIMLKSTILNSKRALLKSFCFFLILLRSITNLTHDFKSPFLDIEITNPRYFCYGFITYGYSIVIFSEVLQIKFLKIPHYKQTC